MEHAGYGMVRALVLMAITITITITIILIITITIIPIILILTIDAIACGRCGPLAEHNCAIACIHQAQRHWQSWSNRRR
jgi:hypothetical protein